LRYLIDTPEGGGKLIQKKRRPNVREADFPRRTGKSRCYVEILLSSKIDEKKMGRIWASGKNSAGPTKSRELSGIRKRINDYIESDMPERKGEKLTRSP